MKITVRSPRTPFGAFLPTSGHPVSTPTNRQGAISSSVGGSRNAAERTIRGLAIGRKNWLFAGSERGGQTAAVAYTLIETAKLNAVDPKAWLADVLSRIADHPASRVDDLLPWNHAG